MVDGEDKKCGDSDGGNIMVIRGVIIVIGGWW